MSKANKKAKQGLWEKASPLVKLLVIIAVIISAAAIYVAYQNNKFTDILNPNHAPEIIYAYPGLITYTNQLTSDSVNTTLKILELRAGIIDKDGDKMTITFWIKNDITPWKGIALFEGYNGTYMYKLQPPYLITALSAGKYMWRIDATDGKETTSRIYPMYVV